MAQDGTVKSIDKAVQILSFLAGSEPGQPLGAISRSLAIHPTTARRLLVSLKRAGMVHQQADTRLYSLGLKLLELGSRVPRQLNLVQAARPVLEKLVAECMETGYLAIYSEGSVIYLDTVECSQTVKTTVQVGQRRPAHTTGTGKALLAYLPETALIKFLENPLEKRTANTITDVDALRAELQAVRNNGYALTLDEHDEGVSSVAAPVRDYNEHVVGAVSLSGPSYRVKRDDLLRMAAQVVRAAQEISSRLGSTRTY